MSDSLLWQNKLYFSNMVIDKVSVLSEQQL